MEEASHVSHPFHGSHAPQLGAMAEVREKIGYEDEGRGVQWTEDSGQRKRRAVKRRARTRDEDEKTGYGDHARAK